MHTSTVSLATLTALLLCCRTTLAQPSLGTAFTYQGELRVGGVPVSETCDFRFGLWDADVAGNEVGASPQTTNAVSVVNGTFGVAIDFGAGAINGDARWLEIEVQCAGDADFVLLSPRVELRPAPHAIRASDGVGPPNSLEIDSVNGRVGIGTIAPDEPLTVAGTIHASSGGFRFPDGSVQITADTGDTLGGLSCATGELAKWDGAQWACAADSDTDTDTDTLAGLTCANGEIAKWDGAIWACAPDSGGDGHSLDAADGDPIDAIYVSDEGEVGIGTSTPTQPLHVVGTMMSENPGSSPLGSTVRLGAPSSDPGLSIQRGNGAGSVARQWDIAVEHTNFLEIRDTTAGVERMVIDTTGRVGIGTTSPATQLDVSGDLHASGTIASGNSITIDGNAYTISSDADLEVHLADGRVMRYESNATAPNVIGGHSSNTIADGVVGATIGGGGPLEPPVAVGFSCDVSPFSGCGRCSIALNNCSTDAQCPPGETCEPDDGVCALLDPSSICEPRFLIRCIGGPNSGLQCGICSGGPNPGLSCIEEIQCGLGGTCVPSPGSCGSVGTCAAPQPNAVLASWATVAGGRANVAGNENAAVVGGYSNSATGRSSVALGGELNHAGGDFSIAAGRGGRVRDAATVGDSNGDENTFVWSDGSTFISTGPRQFLIRAAAGVGINTNDPDVELEINGGSELSLTDGTGFFMIGDQDSTNLAFDTNEIQARVDGAAATLTLNPHGGGVTVGSGGLSASTATISTLLGGTTVSGHLNASSLGVSNNFTVDGNTLYVDATSGLVGIRTTTPTQELTVIGDIVYTGTITDISDERLKQDIAPVADALSKLSHLRGVYFRMKDTPEQRDVGLIAQDVQAVLPEAVSVVDPDNGYLGVAYPSVIPLLVEAIKEQQAVIENRDGRIGELEARLAALERAVKLATKPQP